MSEAEVSVEAAPAGDMPTTEGSVTESAPVVEGEAQKTEDGAQSNTEKTEETGKVTITVTGLAGTVAKHYNDLREGTVQDRFKSRIFFQRNFNNWIKSMLIANSLKAVERKKGCTVLDLCSGKGGDLLKWVKGDVKKLVCADIAAVSVKQCQKRYYEMKDRNRRMGQKTFDAEFIAADCAGISLTDRYRQKDIEFDLCSCQFSLHYSFGTKARARTMLRNACERLRPGGYFIGTIPNAYELVSRLKASEDLSFGNDVYKVTFQNKEKFPLFGCKYNFHLEGVVDCPEFLIYFPLLEEMLKEFDMELVYFKKFDEIYNDNYADDENRALITKMQALEQFPPADESGKPSIEKPNDYVHAETRHKELVSQQAVIDAQEAERKAKEEEERKAKEAEEKAAKEAEQKAEEEGKEETEQNKEESEKNAADGKEKEEKKDGEQEEKKEEKKTISVGTLSQSEWDASSLYCAFAFRKKGEFVESEEEPPKQEEAQKVANGTTEESASQGEESTGGEQETAMEAAPTEEGTAIE